MLQNKSLYPSSAAVSDYFSLLKPRVSMLIAFSAFTGAITARVELNPFLLIVSILLISLGSGGAAAFNMWYDRDIDALMNRTKKRALPSYRMNPESALEFSIVISIISVVVLSIVTNINAGLALLFSILYYCIIYTILLKRNTDHNIVIGGMAGALAPIVGRVSMTGSLDSESIFLAIMIFLWTPPHSWALSLKVLKDYQNASVPMMPVKRGVRTTKRYIILYSVIMVIFSHLPFIVHYGVFYHMIMASLNISFLYYALLLHNAESESITAAHSMKLFKFSIFYLFLFMIVVISEKYIYVL